ncbi:hypothetical protein GY45DRAFT_1374535 [Cubamyces sp. BRFM 1775]|nr:hypothetical protein GY45DRAFT_1374535 [Cubamyces sp. BRFM 1775]
MAQAPHPRSPATTVSSLSSMIEDTKRHVMSYLPPESKVLCLASARIYHSPFGARADTWTSTGLRGMLVFGRDRTTGISVEHDYWFRLVDVDSGKGIIWFHQIPSDIDYHADKPFFHVFSGCSRMFGFRFDEDSDAEEFMKRVTSRIQITAPRSPKPRTTKPTASAAQQTPTGSPRRVSPSMISAPAPGTFMHVAHIGVGDNGRIEATQNVEPGWTMILEELQGYGVNEKTVAQDMDFVEGFLAGAKAQLVQDHAKSTPPVAVIASPLARTATAVSGKKGRFISRKKVPGA